jgi:porphyrinogen peroxidase
MLRAGDTDHVAAQRRRLHGGRGTRIQIGRPPGNYDRLLDFSRAVTGTLFFVPSATFLANIVAGHALSSIADAASKGSEAARGSTLRLSPRDGSLGIGSLKNEADHE